MLRCKRGSLRRCVFQCIPSTHRRIRVGQAVKIFTLARLAAELLLFCKILAPHCQNRLALPSTPSPREIVVPHRQNQQFSSISCVCPQYHFLRLSIILLAPHPCTPFLIGSSLVPATRQRVTSKAHESRQSETIDRVKKVVEILWWKSTESHFQESPSLNQQEFPRNKSYG